MKPETELQISILLVYKNVAKMIIGKWLIME